MERRVEDVAGLGVDAFPVRAFDEDRVRCLEDDRVTGRDAPGLGRGMMIESG
jgi:hypothetical protein